VRARVRELLADRGVAAVVALAFLVLLGTGIVLPTLPLFARSFGVGYGGAGILLAAFGIARLITDVGAGLLVDRVGERIAGASGLALLAASSLATGLAPTFPVAVAFWAFAGVGSAVAFAAQFSFLLRVVARERMARTLSLFYGAFNLGIVAGGLAGGTVAHAFGLSAPLRLNAGLILVAAVLYLRFVPNAPARARARETPSEAELRMFRQGREAIRRLLRTPGFATVVLTNLAYLWMVAAVFDTLVPLFARDALGMSPFGIGVVFAVALAAEFAVLYPAGSAADRRGRKVVLVPALAALAVMTVVVGWAGSPIAFAMLMGFFGLASGVAGVPPAAMLSDVVPEHQSGTGVGAFRFSGDLGFALGPIAAGYAIAPLGFKGAFALVALPTVAVLLLVLRTQETLQPVEVTD
jgi:MFS transporter, DHA1 family, multidrug resistance protein